MVLYTGYLHVENWNYIVISHSIQKKKKSAKLIEDIKWKSETSSSGASQRKCKGLSTRFRHRQDLLKRNLITYKL